MPLVSRSKFCGLQPFWSELRRYCSKTFIYWTLRKGSRRVRNTAGLALSCTDTFHWRWTRSRRCSDPTGLDAGAGWELVESAGRSEGVRGADWVWSRSSGSEG